MTTGLFTLRQQNQAIRQKAWSGTQKTNFVEYLVVAGGGGGGNSYSGGGGAGGLLTGILPVATGSSITATVGGGGAANTNGQDSVFGSITSTGGGYGGKYSATVPNTGGSGGGGASTSSVSLLKGAFGVANQGNRGGNAYRQNGYGGAGGGGAGTQGLDGASDNPGTNGGAGIASSINGTVTTYAGGGGGSGYTASGGSGGVGGGGAGAQDAGTATAGTANTGGGGGGTGTGTAGAGGSGIVIVSYPDVYAAATTTTGSPTVSTSGSGSYSSDGSTTYLNYGNQTALHLGSGSFTVEMWLYKNANTAYMTACGDFPSGSTNTFMILGDATGTKIGWYNGAANAFTLTSTTSLAISTWYHVAVVRSGTTLTLYINGVSEGSTTLSTDYNASTSFFIGQTPELTAGRYWNGYISNFRMVKGTAVYTSNFTPSTIPLTAITNTSLLLNTVSGAYLADGSTNSFVATVVGSPTWNQLSPFATGLGYKNRVYTWTSSGSITF